MISSIVKTKFESVLRDNLFGLDRLDEPDFCDEVPLYARYKEIEFLKEFGNVDLQLIELSLDLLELVASGTSPEKRKRFLAITIIRDDDNEYIVPSIFVCNKDAIRRLNALHFSSLQKGESNCLTGLGRQIELLVKKAGLHKIYSVVEDTHTIPNEVRVFIGHKCPPEGLVGIEQFCTV